MPSNPKAKKKLEVHYPYARVVRYIVPGRPDRILIYKWNIVLQKWVFDGNPNIGWESINAADVTARNINREIHEGVQRCINNDLPNLPGMDR